MFKQKKKAVKFEEVTQNGRVVDSSLELVQS